VPDAILDKHHLLLLKRLKDVLLARLVAVVDLELLVYASLSDQLFEELLDLKLNVSEKQKKLRPAGLLDQASAGAAPAKYHARSPARSSSS